MPFAAAQVVPSLLGGHVDAVVQLPGALAPHVKSGQVRFLAALIPNRDPALPDVPTAREQGFDVSLEAWRGIAVPRGTPRAVDRRARARDPQHGREHGVRAGLRASSASRPAFLPAAEFGALIAKEDAELAKLMQTIGLKKQ